MLPKPGFTVTGPKATVPPAVPQTKRERASSLAEKAKTKAKDALNIHQDAVHNVPGKTTSLDQLEQSGAFNPSSLLGKPEVKGGNLGARASDTLQSTGELFTHPKRYFKTRATKKTAGHLAKRRPYISRTVDLKFLDVYNDLEEARGSRTGSDNEETAIEKKNKIHASMDALKAMEEQRLTLRVAWHTSRHMDQVKVVRSDPGKFPDEAFFEEKDDCGETEFKWGRWIAYTLLYYAYPYTSQYVDDFQTLPYSLSALRRHVERFILVSAPLQEFLGAVRKVYKWDNPAVTGPWMATYFFFWYFGHIMTFVYGYIIYNVVKNYYFPDSVESLRQSIERAQDRSSTAFHIAEVMDQHGRKDWLGPLMDQLGPSIQIQINDLANLLEVGYNFYHWKSPRKTIASLFFISVVFVITASSSADFCLKIFWFVTGLSFFVCWPISAHYPRYRLLVSPSKWVFWDIPTHAEWSVQYLQQHSMAALKAAETQIDVETPAKSNSIGNNKVNDIGIRVEAPSPGSSSDDDGYFEVAERSPPTTESGNDSPPLNNPPYIASIDIVSFSCIHAHTPGHLILTSKTIKFYHSLPSVSKISSQPSASFEFPLTQLDEMRKKTSSQTILAKISKAMDGSGQLELRVRGQVPGLEKFWEGVNATDGSKLKTQLGDRRLYDRYTVTVIVLEAMRDRDKAFNAILGFSGLKWQNLQGDRQ